MIFEIFRQAKLSPLKLDEVELKNFKCGWEIMGKLYSGL